MFCGDFSPCGSGRYIVFILDGIPVKFEGIDIPNVCYVDRSVNADGYICAYPGINIYFFTDCVMKSSPDWKQLGMMMPSYKLSDIKKIVRSLFPRYALKFDKVIDADDYIEVEWMVEVPKLTNRNVWGVEKSKALAGGRKVTIAFNAIRHGAQNELPTPSITSPKNCILLAVKYHPNGGKYGRMFMTIAVPPQYTAQV